MNAQRDPVTLLVQAVFVLTGVLLGVLVAQRVPFLAESPINTVYIGVVGGLIGILVGGRPAQALRDVVVHTVENAMRLPPQTVLAVTVALILALLVSVLLNSILQQIPGYSWFLSVIITFALATILVSFAARGQEVFAPLATRRHDSIAPRYTKVLDTSVIIDGRILDVARVGFIDGPFIVPSFVLRELQHFADQADAQRRAKGRRGLEVLERLRASGPDELVVRDFADTGGNVDDRLVAVAVEIGAALVTNDTGLAKIAALQGVKVMNLNALAEALKPRYGAGDEITITVVKEGSQAGQGVGYLEDGTMVVVEDGVALRGRTVRVAVTSNIQTALGRMIFAKPKEVV